MANVQWRIATDGADGVRRAVGSSRRHEPVGRIYPIGVAGRDQLDHGSLQLTGRFIVVTGRVRKEPFGKFREPMELFIRERDHDILWNCPIFPFIAQVLV
jgi:hypothetical protein